MSPFGKREPFIYNRCTPRVPHRHFLFARVWPRDMETLTTVDSCLKIDTHCVLGFLRMAEVSIFPDAPDANWIVQLAKLLCVCGFSFVFGRTAAKMKIPIVVGYVIAGLLSGPYLLNFVTSIDLESEFYTQVKHFTIHFVGMVCGLQTSIKHIGPLLKQIILIASVVTALLIIFNIILGVVMIPNQTIAEFLPTNTLLVIVGVFFGLASSGRSSTVAVAIPEERGCYGTFAKTILGVTIFNDSMSLILFGGFLGAVRGVFEGTTVNVWALVVETISNIVIMFGVGVGTAWLIHFVCLINPRPRRRALREMLWVLHIALVGIIGIVIYNLSSILKGLCERYGSPVIITYQTLPASIIAGVLVQNYMKSSMYFSEIIARAMKMTFLLFFTTAGMSTRVDLLINLSTIGYACVHLLLRFLANFIGITTVFSFTRSRERKAKRRAAAPEHSEEVFDLAAGPIVDAGVASDTSPSRGAEKPSGQLSPGASDEPAEDAHIPMKHLTFDPKDDDAPEQAEAEAAEPEHEAIEKTRVSMKHLFSAWMAFLAQAAAALTMSSIIAESFPEWGDFFNTVVTFSFVLSQFVGPISMGISLKMSGEATNQSIQEEKGKEAMGSLLVFGSANQPVTLFFVARMLHMGWRVCLCSVGHTSPESGKFDHQPGDKLVHRIGSVLKERANSLRKSIEDDLAQARGSVPQPPPPVEPVAPGDSLSSNPAEPAAPADPPVPSSSSSSSEPTPATRHHGAHAKRITNTIATLVGSYPDHIMLRSVRHVVRGHQYQPTDELCELFEEFCPDVVVSLLSTDHADLRALVASKKLGVTRLVARVLDPINLPQFLALRALVADPTSALAHLTSEFVTERNPAGRQALSAIMTDLHHGMHHVDESGKHHIWHPSKEESSEPDSVAHHLSPYIMEHHPEDGFGGGALIGQALNSWASQLESDYSTETRSYASDAP
eukprot:gnl/Chilomastix_cuspidata/1411.p1 GENE.gnl/Chilomastix_cuspidata/1411~~gnl/Chilomastix_cuspidata/1411.p1  ORF type:complete len:949 (+),score=320.94 gnl/Chilomastix_cuspidata/1411:2815-5661(+)